MRLKWACFKMGLFWRASVDRSFKRFFFSSFLFFLFFLSALLVYRGLVGSPLPEKMRVVMVVVVVCARVTFYEGNRYWNQSLVP